ncbi:DUF4010 domain-containing protein, partial [bacterium]|nr:DUF4010 domain-containing protein [bacterium]
AWSMGGAAGIFSSCFFYRLGFTMLSALIVLVGIVILVVLLMHKPRPAGVPSADEHVERGSWQAPKVDPIYVWIGWLMIFMAVFVLRPINSFFPAISAKAGVSAFVTGLPLFLQMALQAVVGLAMIRWRHLLYRRTPLGLAHGGAAVLLLVAAGKDHFGDAGLFTVAALSGLTDMDAITLSTAQYVDAGRLTATDGWRAILVAAVANLVFKVGIVALLGNRRMLAWVAALFGAAVVAGALILAFWPAGVA